MRVDDMFKKRKRNVIPAAVASVAESVIGSKVVDKASKWLKKRGKKKNPPDDGLDSPAAELSEKWHGRKPRTHMDVEEYETYEETLAELGDLEELGVLGADLVERHIISFKKDRPKVCASDEHNLEIIDGDQKINVESVGVERDGKRLVPLGYCYSIVYETDKHHLEDSKGTIESYEHFFAEEFYKDEGFDVNDFENSEDWFQTVMEEGLVEQAVGEGRIPMLVYNKTDEKLVLAGGNYSVEDVGIKD